MIARYDARRAEELLAKKEFRMDASLSALPSINSLGTDSQAYCASQ